MPLNSQSIAFVNSDNYKALSAENCPEQEKCVHTEQGYQTQINGKAVVRKKKDHEHLFHF